MTYTDASGNERDLEAEKAAFEQRNFSFTINRPMHINPPDPKIKREFLAQAWKHGDNKSKFQAGGATEDEALAKLLDLMFEEVPLSDR